MIDILEIEKLADNSKHFPEMLELGMLAAKMNQGDIARMVRVEQPTVSFWMTRRTKANYATRVYALLKLASKSPQLTNLWRSYEYSD